MRVAAASSSSWSCPANSSAAASISASAASAASAASRASRSASARASAAASCAALLASISPIRAACSAGSPMLRIPSVSATAAPTTASAVRERALRASGATEAAGSSSSCSSRMSSRRRSLPSYMEFCTARPRNNRCSSPAARARATAASGSGASGVSGRSSFFAARRLRLVTSVSTPEVGHGHASPNPRPPLSADSSSRPVMWSSWLATCAACLSVAVCGTAIGGRLVFIRIVSAGMADSSSNMPL
mmetsp:Transcript_41985/g.134018  ORF Transcript_41985/g.134018 Transcript_41985/m.134018 type:complete len:247 (-) Transcript_41985:1204-1944(-)